LRPPDLVGRAVLLATALFSSCSGADGSGPAKLAVWNPPPGDAVRSGGFSDLTLDPSDTAGRTFFAIEDRGPNLASDGIARFAHPTYHQKISRFALESDGTVRRVGLDSVRTARGRWTTGLPSPLFSVSERAVPAVSVGSDETLAPDSAGFDFEGLAADGRGGFWASDEYGPRIVHMVRDAAGLRLDSVRSPGRGLPEVFARRAPNKGLEALCRTPKGRLVAAFQGALDNAVEAGQEVATRSLARRLVVIEPDGAGVREFLEEAPDDPDGKSSRRTKTGACAAIDEDRVVMLEHRKKGKGRVEIDLVLLDLSVADDVHRRPDPQGRGRLVEGKTLEEVALRRRGLAQAGIRTVSRQVLVADLAAGIDAPLAKPEGLLLLPDQRWLVVFDNDYGVDGTSDATRFLLGDLPALPAPR